MTAAPPRANLAGSPTNAVAKAALAQQFDYLTERLEGVQVNVASAATVDIGSQASSSVNITGTTTITSLGTVYSGIKALRFAGILTLTHNATTLILPTGANITTQAGDQCWVAPNANPATGWRVLSYQRADGTALVAAAGGGGAFKNKLINGVFGINQRGYVSATATTVANQYTLDRWRVVTSGQNLTFSASGNGSQITAPAGGVEQVIEGNLIEGGTYVLNWVGTATASVGGTPRTKGENFTLTANTNVTVRFTSGTVSQAQLELGTAPTSFENRLFGTELALCMRYFEKSFPYATAVANNAGVSGALYFTQCIGAGGGQGGQFAVFKVPKRAAPTTLNIHNPSAANNQVRNVGRANDCTTSAVLGSETGFSFSVTTSAGSGAGDTMAYHFSAESEL